MYAEERRQHILDQLKRNRRVDVTELASRLDTSSETIRRDLNSMEVDGFCKRTHGGAIYLGENDYRSQISVIARREMNHEQKSRVAKAAAELVQEGDVIVIDNSTTAAYLLDYLPTSRKITIVTYSLPVMTGIAEKGDANWTGISLGGVLQNRSLSTHGLITSTALGFFQPMKLFMSCAGIGSGGQLTEGELIDAEVKRELIQACREKILLVDDSKWIQSGTVNAGQLSDMDYLITTSGIPRDRLDMAQEAKVHIIFA